MIKKSECSEKQNGTPQNKDDVGDYDLSSNGSDSEYDEI